MRRRRPDYEYTVHVYEYEYEAYGGGGGRARRGRRAPLAQLGVLERVRAERRERAALLGGRAPFESDGAVGARDEAQRARRARQRGERLEARRRAHLAVDAVELRAHPVHRAPAEARLWHVADGRWQAPKAISGTSGNCYNIPRPTRNCGDVTNKSEQRLDRKSK